ncbi:Signal peptidase I [Desulfarculales bacterium]
MEPTLLVDYRVLVNKLAFEATIPFIDRVILPLGQPQRGDMVVFASPGGLGDDPIKRVIGLPGEVVELQAKQIYIDGRPLAVFWERDTAFHAPADDFGPVLVPEGHYFMLGDNRDRS